MQKEVGSFEELKDRLLPIGIRLETANGSHLRFYKAGQCFLQYWTQSGKALRPNAKEAEILYGGPSELLALVIELSEKLHFPAPSGDPSPIVAAATPPAPAPAPERTSVDRTWVQTFWRKRHDMEQAYSWALSEYYRYRGAPGELQDFQAKVTLQKQWVEQKGVEGRQYHYEFLCEPL